MARGGEAMKLVGLLIAIIVMWAGPVRQAAADKAEDAATAECKAKSDPSILLRYWKSVAAAPATPSAQTEMETRARTICVARGGGASRSYRIAGNAGPMAVSGTACDLAKPFTVSGSGGGMKVTFSY